MTLTSVTEDAAVTDGLTLVGDFILRRELMLRNLVFLSEPMTLCRTEVSFPGDP